MRQTLNGKRQSHHARSANFAEGSTAAKWPEEQKQPAEHGAPDGLDDVHLQLDIIRKHFDRYSQAVTGILKVQLDRVLGETEAQIRSELLANSVLKPKAADTQTHEQKGGDGATPQGNSKGRGTLFAAGKALAAATQSSELLVNYEKQREQRAKCFVDATALKAQVRETLYKKPYNVFDFYTETGAFQCIAKSPYFDWFTLFIIACNALWIAIDADNNDAEVLLYAEPLFQIIENAFCAYFFMEWLIRFGAFKNKRDCIKDGWFNFDSLLLAVMIMETWVITLLLLAAGKGGDDASTNGMPVGNASLLKILRLVRLSRMARIARLLRLCPELLILLKGISVAIRSVFFTLALLIGIVYVFSVTFTQLTRFGFTDVPHFPNVTQSMLSLFLRVTFPDVADLVEEIARDSLLVAGLLVIYLLIGALTIMNMLVGILVDVVSVVSAVEKEQLSVYYVRQQLEDLCKAHDIAVDDPDDPAPITRDDFVLLLEDSRTAAIIQDTGADAGNVIDFITFLYKTKEQIPFATFVEVVLNLRPTNQSTVKDVADVRKLVVSELVQELHELEDRLVDHLVHQESSVIAHTTSMAHTASMAQRVSLGSKRGSADVRTSMNSSSMDYPCLSPCDKDLGEIPENTMDEIGDKLDRLIHICTAQVVPDVCAPPQPSPPPTPPQVPHRLNLAEDGSAKHCADSNSSSPGTKNAL
eukprot:TRINITY_DN92933_c0_g1_i1.p1 TRINITY_DN92933_c0_g1~~TRINITY_DN92933_c0_g1_i1.p1  ORF type:complete len:699 (+),score=123.68 TRINITY_DN92933_c0_g1_i1:99-2195(+)